MKLEDMTPLILDFGKDGKVELVPLKHGIWKRTLFESRWYNRYPESRWQCSICGHTQITGSPYCGGCGARMDGDSNG